MSLSNSSQLMTANNKEDDLVVNQLLNDKRITPKGSHIEIFVDCIDCHSKLKA